MLEGEVVVPEGFQVEMTRRAALLLLGRVEVDEVGVRVVRAHLQPRINVQVMAWLILRVAVFDKSDASIVKGQG